MHIFSVNNQNEKANKNGKIFFEIDAYKNYNHENFTVRLARQTTVFSFFKEQR